MDAADNSSVSVNSGSSLTGTGGLSKWVTTTYPGIIASGSLSPVTTAGPRMIYKKMSEVMKEIRAVGKDQTNSAQGFKFRGIDQFVNALYPALCKHGVFMTVNVLERSENLKDVVRGNGKQSVDKHVAIRVCYTFHAEDGSCVSSVVAAEGLDSGDKATNKALSAALKYCLIQTFSIPTEDMAEADLESPEIGVPAKSNPVKETTPVAAAPVQAAAPSSSYRKSSFRKSEAKPAPVEEVDGWS